MSIQDTIAQDQSAVDAAVEKMIADGLANQAILDAANAQLALDKAKLADLTPHLDLIAKIEAELLAIEEGVSDTLKTALDTVKQKIAPFLQEMKNILNG